MNLLIIEDDSFLAWKIKTIFQKKVLINRVKILSDYKEFLSELYLINSYDLVLVDILLWDEKDNNWIDIIRKIRDKNNILPIIIISGLNDVWWLKLAFETWASDYLCKPFRLAELEVRALKCFNNFLTISNATYNSYIEFSWLKYYFNTNEFYFDWNKMKITKLNKYILLLFIKNKGNLLTNLYLIEKIWWDSNLVDRNLRVVIFRLKQNLKIYWIDNLIENIRGEGYILKKK